MEVPEFLEPTLAEYQRRRIGRRVGFGQRPAVLVVDMQRGFTDRECPLASDLDSELAAIARVLDAARAGGHPIMFSTLAFSPDLRDAGTMAVKGSGMRLLDRNGPWVEIDPRVGPGRDDLVFEKVAASCFFGTDLLDRLRTLDVDTLIVTGCTTSGCVRATVVDSSSHGFRTIVVEEGVGDRALVPHVVSLFDMDAKYGDVVPAAEVNAYLSKTAAASG
jgi:maleamate amidohydrolase